MANLATINNNLLADSGIDPLSVVIGSGTANQIAYWIDADNIGALTTATYPSLTELSYVKGVTSSIQTQLNAKQATLTLTTTGTSGAATLVGATLNIPQYQSVLTNPVTGTGTANYIPKWTSASAIGNSALQEVSGNLGLNVTPPAWSLFKAINIGGSSVSTNGSLSIILSRNWYFDGAEKYYENGTAQRLELVANGFYFQTAISNTSGAGAALTWVSAMTLKPSAQLQLNQYGGGSFTGTRAYDLAVDASGNIIEVAVGAGTVTGTGTANYHAKWTSGSAIGNSLIYDDGTLLGINTTTLTKNINFAGTFRYERVYAYGNYSFNFSNAGALATAWFHLGSASPFSQTRIFYRAGSSTSEEEGEIRISNTCVQPFIEWTRNTYNYHILEVRGRMTGSCGQCEVWALIRYGNFYGGANTNFQWQIHGGTDASFAVVNSTGTPGTGTSEISVNTTSGYFYANSGDLYVANRIGIGTTSPQYDLQANGGFADGANGYVATFHSSIGSTGDAYIGIGAYRSDALGAGRNAYINAIAPSGGSGTLLLQTTGGNVSIGTATPGISAKLLVEGNSIVLNTEGSNQAKSIYFRYSDGGDLRSDTYLTFSTGGSPSEKARLTATGNFGINSTNPTSKLYVVGGGTLNTREVLAEFRGAGDIGRIDIRDESTVGSLPPGLYSNTAGFGLGLYAAAGPLILYAGGITAADERVRILTSGAFGINTTTPQQRLDVFSNAVTNTAVFFGASIATGEWSGVSFGYGEKANSNYRKAALVFERVDASARGKIHILNNNAADTSSASLSDARVTIASTGVVTLSNLAGTGSRIVVADASGNLSASAALSGYVTGSGTTNYVTKWTGGSAVGNSQIFDDGSNVGINTASPSYKLDVNGSVRIGQNLSANGFLLLENWSASTTNNLFQIRNSNTTEGNALGILFYGIDNNGNDRPGNGAFIRAEFVGRAAFSYQTNLLFGTSGSEKMRITSGGLVGINTTTPEALFSIANTSGQLIHHVFATVTLGNNSTWYRVAQLNNNLRADIELFISTVFGGAFGSTRVRISSIARTIQAEWGNVNNGYAIRGVRLATESGVTYLEILSNETAPAVTITSSYIRGTNFTPLAFTSTLGSTATDTFLFSDYSAFNGGSLVGTIGASAGYNYSIVTESSERLRVIGNGQIRFSNYTSSSSFTGTAAGLLAFTSAGNIITLSSTLFPSGSGTTNYITKWTGANSVGNSQIFDNGSNVGIFTTPQTWTTNRQTVQVGNTVALSAGTAWYPWASFLGNNVYYDSSDVARYINASGASLFYFNAHGGGNFSWSVADPGAAGSAITFRTPMALNNAGQLSIVGTSNTANNLTVVGNIRAGGSGTTGGEIIASGGLSNGNYVAMRHDDYNGYITVTRTVYDGNLVLQPYAAVLVNTTSRFSNARFQVYGAEAYNGLAVIRNDANQGDVNHGALMIMNRSPYAIGNDASIAFALEYDGYPHPRASIGAKTASEYGADLVFNTRSDAGTYSEKVRISQDGNFGINTTAPNRRLTVFGTTRHERIYGYGNYVLPVANSVSYGTVWIHLGTCNPFTTDKIYYRVNTNTSEEEGEITISNTCSLPFIQWQRNTYNAMIVQVRARMTGGCGNCQIWVQMRYGSDYGGANTTLQWQAYNGTDSGFTVVNATGTPGTGTNEKSIVGNEGYFYANSGSITVADNIGIGTTAPSAKLHIDSALGNDAIRISDAAGSVRMSIGQEASYQGNYINTRNIDMKLQTYLAGGSGGNIIFQTQDNGTASMAERGRFTPAGNFGIGTSNPLSRLHVTGSGTANTRGIIARFHNSADSLRVYITDEHSDSRAPGLNSDAGYGLGLYTTSVAPIIFYTGGSTLSDERMRVTGAGEIWMGYTTDQGAYRLQVNGSTFSSSGFFESSDIRLKTIFNRHQSVNFDAIEYKWNDGRDSKLHWGYAAQEVMKWLPDAVNGSEENYYTLDYNQVHTYKIAMLEKRIAELEQQLKNK